MRCITWHHTNPGIASLRQIFIGNICRDHSAFSIPDQICNRGMRGGRRIQKHLPHQAEIQSIYSIVLIQIPCFPVNQSPLTVQPLLHHNKVCYGKDTICIDIAFYITSDRGVKVYCHIIHNRRIGIVFCKIPVLDQCVPFCFCAGKINIAYHNQIRKPIRIYLIRGIHCVKLPITIFCNSKRRQFFQTSGKIEPIEFLISHNRRRCQTFYSLRKYYRR